MGLSFFIPWLLYSSLSGSILVGLIILIRLVFKNRLNANLRYLLWLLLIVKLLVPCAPQSPFSVFNLFQYGNIQTWVKNYIPIQPQDNEGQNSDKKPFNTEILHWNDDYSLSVNRTSVSHWDIVLGVWFLGIISLALLMIHSAIRLKRMIINGRPVDIPVAGLLEECRKTVGIKNTPMLIESSLIQSPKVLGVFRPCIVLPAGITCNLSYEEIRFILLHELAHLHRKDLYIHWLTAFLQLIHWFNPLLWYGFYQMRQDRELACDFYVLSLLKPAEYKSYGAAIISFLERYSYRAYDYPAAGLASNKAHIKKRIALIASYKKRAHFRVTGVILELLLFLLLGCLVLTDAEKPSPGTRFSELPNINRNIEYVDFSDYFHGYDGTFILLDMKKDHYQIYNKANSNQRISPDSTYKIVSSLMGLETRVIPNENTLLEWDGTIYPFKPWNRDQTLTSAIASSVNWYFQKVDSRVGQVYISNHLKQIAYGNCDLSGGLHDFWIESSLKISPLEQVEILKKLCTYELPFSRRNIDIVQRAIKISEQNQVSLHGKTGTGVINGGNGNGWFIGFVKREANVYIFATHIQGKKGVNGTKARNITLAILKEQNIL